MRPRGRFGTGAKSGIGRWPKAAAVEALERLDEALPATQQHDTGVIALLDEIASPATVATSGGRYFGFVTGSSLPATLAANWLAGAWDQNAGGVIQSPAAARLEEVALPTVYVAPAARS
jgi:glutamate/tyrosine decarboxylase-like PLP-dependent enzyme